MIMNSSRCADIFSSFSFIETDRVAEFDMKLMDIDSEHLGIPDTQYDAVVRLSSSEFARITRDLSNVGDSVRISATKEGVSFSAEGDIGKANLTLKQGSGTAANVDDEEDSDDDGPKKKKRKGASSSNKDDETVPVRIELQQSVALTFSLKYLLNFSKAAPLSREVALHMSSEVPLLVSLNRYSMQGGSKANFLSFLSVNLHLMMDSFDFTLHLSLMM